MAMKHFPLAPFLAALASDGIYVTLHDHHRIALALRAGGDWDLRRLRGVLLALLIHDGEQEELFIRRFNAFFDHHLQTEFSPAELAHAVNDLQRLAREPVTKAPSKTPGRRIPINASKRLFPLAIRLALWLLLLIALLAIKPSFSTAPHQPAEPDIRPSAGAMTNIKPENPTLTNPTYDSWAAPIIIASVIALLSAILLIGLDVVLGVNEAVEWYPGGPHRFRLGALGGQPAPILDANTLDELADSMGYFNSEQAGAMLDVAASVTATGHNYGIPTLIYGKQKRLRAVIILEDLLAEARAWNHSCDELTEGLSRRGIPVRRYRFRGSLARLSTDLGAPVWLEDLEDHRYGQLVLIFSDGKGLTPADRFLLETLANWPMAAWIELREPCFWDESTAIPVRHGLPVYPATSAGLLEVMQSFLTEQGRLNPNSEAARNWRGIPPRGQYLDGYVEQLLRDALPWAQACAMIQPVPLGLADLLRREFHPRLPAERVERLLMLPATTRTVSGLRFSLPVLSILRAGFSSQWEKERQDEVLRFILRQLKEVEPEQVYSLAHVNWEAIQERVRLELEPEKALHRLAQLVKTPLGDFIRTELKNVVLPGQPLFGKDSSGSFGLVLRRRPRTRKALQQLSVITAGDAGRADKGGTAFLGRGRPGLTFLFKQIYVPVIIGALIGAGISWLSKPTWSADDARHSLALAMRNERRIAPIISGGLGYSPYVLTRGSVDSPDSYYDLALSQLKFAENEEAAPAARLDLARVHLAIGSPEHVRQSLAILESLLARGFRSPEILNDLGATYYELQDYNRAITTFSQALALVPDFDISRFNRALAWESMTMYREAMQDFHAFINLSADSNLKVEAMKHLTALQDYFKRIER